MDKALYIAMTGAKHNMLAQSVHANNMANLNTAGFRADFAQARSMAVYGGEGQPTRAYALTESPATKFDTGSMMETGRDLDFAIENQGFLAIQAADGAEAYVRGGSLQVTPEGLLTTNRGEPVLGDGGPIVIPPFEKLDIASDGSITVMGLGEGPKNLIQVDRIRLVDPDTADLYKGKDGLLRARDGADVGPSAGARLQSGFLESSNVNAIEEFTEILSLARQYELQVKMMKTIEGNSESSARLLQST